MSWDSEQAHDSTSTPARDSPQNEAARLFYRALANLAKLAERGIGFLITQSQAILNGRRQYFLRDLFKASDYIFRLDTPGAYTLESRRHVPIAAGGR